MFAYTYIILIYAMYLNSQIFLKIPRQGILKTHFWTKE